MPCTTPSSTSGSREPLGWTCRTVRCWTPWWTSPMPCGSWVYADGGPRTRQGSPVTAGRRTVPTPRSPTRRRQQQSSAGWRRRNAQKMRFPSLRQSFLQGWQFFLMSRSARLRQPLREHHQQTLPLHVRHHRRRCPQIPVPSNRSTIAASVASCWEMENGLRWLPMRSHAVDVHRLCAGAD